jgi:hypothetical protein
MEEKSITKIPDAEAEKLAEKVVQTFTDCCQKLRDLKPEIEKIQLWFQQVKGSRTLMGCFSFPEFCEKKLHRTKQAVYAMLGDYSQKEKKEPSTNKPQKSELHQELSLAQEDMQRLIAGNHAATRMVEAQEAGDEAAAEKAKKEFKAIAAAQPLKSVAFQPDYKATHEMLVNLLALLEKYGEKVPVAVTVACREIRNKLDADKLLPKTITEQAEEIKAEAKAKGEAEAPAILKKMAEAKAAPAALKRTAAA